jgi:PPOX class probable F420-dependent enzyme
VTSPSALERFAAARVARLATVGPDGRPHLVPITFALSPSESTPSALVTAVDAKPKTTTALRRLANIAANPRVSVLVDHYDEDWTALWWARVDGAARVHEPGTPEARAAVALLTARYPQYRDRPPPGPVIVIEVNRWSSWSAAGRGGLGGGSVRARPLRHTGRT